MSEKEQNESLKQIVKSKFGDSSEDMVELEVESECGSKWSTEVV